MLVVTTKESFSLPPGTIIEVLDSDEHFYYGRFNFYGGSHEVKIQKSECEPFEGSIWKYISYTRP